MKKRIIENTFGVIFNCLATCAVHIDLATDYSSEKISHGPQKICVN